jgi:hypothetical protein
LKYQVLNYPPRRGLDECVRFIKKEAYLDTAISKMYGIEPIGTGLVMIPITRSDGSTLEIRTAILCWSNGIIMVLRDDDTGYTEYLCYTKPDKVTIDEQEKAQEQTAQ